MAVASTNYYDIIISGCGPAGCAAALALHGSGLRIAMVDKATFPRDKVCGDAIPGRAIKVLRTIAPQLAEEFTVLPEKFTTRNTALYYNRKHLSFKWVQEAYTCSRMVFDDFLFQHTAALADVDIFQSSPVSAVKITNETVAVAAGGRELHAKLLIGADGAHSVVAKQLTDRIVDKNHYVGSVRAYYKDVACDSDDTTEIYFDKKFLPSYLWVFPLPGNKANVGFGMLSSEIARRRINIKNAFYDFIEQTPVLKEKFCNASQIGNLEGFGLPLGSRMGTLSGSRFMLCGDAASLIDPISGDGIGNAMLSGMLAAAQAKACFAQNNFTGEFMNGYDLTLRQRLSKELRTRYRVQQLLSSMPFLLNAAFTAGNIPIVRKAIQKQL